jgi:phage shock protein PspC (stress-responsive transcriptional regulator)
VAATIPLRRVRRDRVIAGVLGGFARHYELDPALLRIVYAVATIFTAFFGVIVYLMCWIVIPEDQDAGGATLDGKPLDRG